MERYKLHNFGPTSPANHMDRNENGGWVRYIDHLKALEELAEEFERRSRRCPRRRAARRAYKRAASKVRSDLRASDG
jgi:hypothetical protein